LGNNEETNIQEVSEFLPRREFDLWKSYHEREISLNHAAHDKQHEIEKEAEQKAETALDKRLEGMNEFREQLKEQAAGFITRDMSDERLKNLQDQITLLRDASASYMTVDRFDREHKALIDSTNTAITDLSKKLVDEEKVTVRQDATQALIDKINDNRKWLIGIGATSILSLVTLLGHLFKLF
jgi:hypothetical protein